MFTKSFQAVNFTTLAQFPQASEAVYDNWSPAKAAADKDHSMSSYYTNSCMLDLTSPGGVDQYNG